MFYVVWQRNMFQTFKRGHKILFYWRSLC